jgi:MFS transporter, ACS family, hexuronate transporter
MKLRHIRWYIAALLFLSSVINYVDRQTLSVVAPSLTKQLHLSPVEYSNVLQAFLVTYTLMYLGSGFLVDRWGTRTSLARFMAFWSASNMLHAFARTAFQLGVFRALLGIGEPGNFMAGFKAISEWYPPREKAFVSGLLNGGAAVGAIIAAPLVVWIMVVFNWQTAFIATGALGFVWLVAWLMFYRLPEQHPWITGEELALVRAGTGLQPGEPAAVAIPRRELLQKRQTWGLLLSRFISDPVWWFYLFWLPKYLVEERHFSIVHMGMLAWLPYLTADLGSFGGGIASGWLVKLGWEPLRARKVMLLPCALLMPLSLLIPSSSAAVAMLIISVVTFSHMAWKTNLMTITNDIYPVGLIGSVSGIIAFGSGLGGTLFTSLTGQVVQHYSYTAIFAIMGFLHPASYLLVRWLVRTPLTSSSSHSAPAHPEQHNPRHREQLDPQVSYSRSKGHSD